MPIRAAGSLAIALVSALLWAAPASASGPDLETALGSATDGIGGTVSVVVIDLTSGYRYERNASAKVEAASLFKLFVMAALYRDAEANPEIFEVPVGVTRPHVTGDQVEYQSERETVGTALAEMIDWSDNEATRSLVDLLGVDQVNATIGSLGLSDTVVLSGEPSGNTTSARDVARFFELLARGQAVSPSASESMMRVLLHQGINDRLSQGLPKDALFAHKTGNSAGTVHDAGIMWTPYGVRVVVGLTSGVSGDTAPAVLADVGYWAYTLPAPN